MRAGARVGARVRVTGSRVGVRAWRRCLDGEGHGFEGGRKAWGRAGIPATEGLVRPLHLARARVRARVRVRVRVGA